MKNFQIYIFPPFFNQNISNKTGFLKNIGY